MPGMTWFFLFSLSVLYIIHPLFILGSYAGVVTCDCLKAQNGIYNNTIYIGTQSDPYIDTFVQCTMYNLYFINH